MLLDKQPIHNHCGIYIMNPSKQRPHNQKPIINATSGNQSGHAVKFHACRWFRILMIFLFWPLTVNLFALPSHNNSFVTNFPLYAAQSAAALEDMAARSIRQASGDLGANILGIEAFKSVSKGDYVSGGILADVAKNQRITAVGNAFREMLQNEGRWIRPGTALDVVTLYSGSMTSGKLRLATTSKWDAADYALVADTRTGEKLGVIILSDIDGSDSVQKMITSREEALAPKQIFFGYDWGNEHAIAYSIRDGVISMVFRYGDQAQSHPLQLYSLCRAALLHVADQLHIPPATNEEVTDCVQNLAFFMSTPSNPNESPKFDIARYRFTMQNPSHFSDYISRIPNLPHDAITLNDLARIINEDIRIAAIAKTITRSGHNIPADVQQILKHVNGTWTLQAAVIDRDAFKPAVTAPTDLEINQYFEANRSHYTTAPRVRVSYIEIPARVFADTIMLNGDTIRAFYDANRASYSKDSDFTAIRPQVEATLRQQLARNAAYKAASDLSYKLYSANIPIDSPEFTRFLEQNRASLKTAPEFSEADIPAPLSANAAAIAKEIAVIDATNRISNAIDLGASSVILIWQDGAPARELTSGEAHDKVVTDLIAQEKQKLFIALGQTIKAQIQAALKTGATFEQAATDAGAKTGLAVAVKNIPPLSFRNVTQQTVESFIAASLNNLNQGDITDMITDENTGYIVYVRTLEEKDEYKRRQ